MTPTPPDTPPVLSEGLEATMLESLEKRRVELVPWLRELAEQVEGNVDFFIRNVHGRLKRTADVLNGYDSALKRALRRLQTAETRLEAAERERDGLRGEVREWLCADCNYVYPGPPSKGFDCIICPRCQGRTGPRPTVEKHAAEAELEATRSRLERYETALEQARHDLERIANRTDAEMETARTLHIDMRGWAREAVETLDNALASARQDKGNEPTQPVEEAEE